MLYKSQTGTFFGRMRIQHYNLFWHNGVKETIPPRPPVIFLRRHKQTQMLQDANLKCFKSYSVCKFLIRAVKSPNMRLVMH